MVSADDGRTAIREERVQDLEFTERLWEAAVEYLTREQINACYKEAKR
jgi:hypothetical protein